jgi:hypothetical protein
MSIIDRKSIPLWVSLHLGLLLAWYLGRVGLLDFHCKSCPLIIGTIELASILGWLYPERPWRWALALCAWIAPASLIISPHDWPGLPSLFYVAVALFAFAFHFLAALPSSYVASYFKGCFNRWRRLARDLKGQPAPPTRWLVRKIFIGE